MQYGGHMKFHLDDPGDVNFIRGYTPGRLQVGDHTLASSAIVTATALLADWRPTRAEDIAPADLEPLLGLAPEVVLIGTGVRQQFPSPEVLRLLYEQRIGVEVMDTSAACRTFNVLVAESRPVAAALIV